MQSPKTIFLIAGEESGDSRGAELIYALKKENPALQFEALGGPKMKAAGAKLFFDLTSLAVLGFGDVLRQYFKIRKIFYNTLRYIEELKPAAIILIDYPGFNVRFAKKINKKFPVFYYVSPQIWAWAGHRIHTIKRVVSHMLVLFQFEEKLYRDAGVPVTWVGHPLVHKFETLEFAKNLKQELNILENTPVVALLPGSRESEVKRILPVILESASLIQKQIPNVHFILSETSQVPRALYDSILDTFQKNNLVIKRVSNQMYDILKTSDTALVASGTATLETAMMEVPFLILYKTAWSTYEIGKRVITLPYIGMPNVIAGKKIIPEFIQHDAEPTKIANETFRLLQDTDYRNHIVKELKAVKAKLGPTGASERTAKTINSLLK